MIYVPRKTAIADWKKVVKLGFVFFFQVPSIVFLLD